MVYLNKKKFGLVFCKTHRIITRSVPNWDKDKNNFTTLKCRCGCIITTDDFEDIKIQRLLFTKRYGVLTKSVPEKYTWVLEKE